jgi:hypothetical protein
LASGHRGCFHKALAGGPGGEWFEGLAHSSLRPSVSGPSLASGSTGRKSGRGGGSSTWKMIQRSPRREAKELTTEICVLPPVQPALLYNNLEGFFCLFENVSKARMVSVTFDSHTHTRPALTVSPSPRVSRRLSSTLTTQRHRWFPPLSRQTNLKNERCKVQGSACGLRREGGTRVRGRCFKI